MWSFPQDNITVCDKAAFGSFKILVAKWFSVLDTIGGDYPYLFGCK